MSVSLPVAAAVAGAFYIFWRIFYPYFTSLAIDALPGPPLKSWFFGHIFVFSERQAWKTFAQWADTYGTAFVIKSIFGRRIIMTYDPKAINSILIKDQENWPKSLDRTTDFKLLLGPGILTAEGHQHKRQRKLLNPVFSAAHLRNMTHIFYKVAHKLNDAIIKRLPQDGSADEIDINGWMARATLEMLGQAGLGYSFDDFTEDSTDTYGESLKLFFPSLSRVILLGFAVAKTSWLFPDRLWRFLMRSAPYSPLNKIMEIGDIMDRRSREIVAEKKALLAKGDAALAHEVGEGKDIMSICLKANMAAAEHERMTDDEIHSQMSTFILAGMDTTSNALSRILHILAQNPEAQDKLRAEVTEAMGGDTADIAYDDLVKLPYLDAVCRETLRLQPPVIMNARVACRDTILPLSQPVRARDGRDLPELVVTRGTPVIMLIQAFNTNKDLWGEDATEWKPERWLGPLPTALEEARVPGVYANLMTFAAGSHSCIGFKFSQLEMKVILAVLLSSFSFSLSDKPVNWVMSGVLYPTMGEDNTKPELVLKAKAIKA